MKYLIYPLRQDIRSKEQEAIKAKTVAGGSSERRKHLAKCIREFRSVQKIYMPGLSHLLDNADGDSRLDARPELFKLMLPSQLTPDDRQSWCLPGIPVLEARFRYAQADDALSEIRRLRRLFQGLSDQNKKHINNSQNTMTRAKATFERYKARISRSATLYRLARRALTALDPNGEITEWTTRFLELKDSDLRGPGREDDEPTEGRVVSSWIWLVPQSSRPLDRSHPNDDPNGPDKSDLSQRAASGEEVAVSIRAHWARCQARAERHEEEVQLTLEEMRRVLEFFEWKSKWWLASQESRAASENPPDPQVQHGLRAYAHRQAATYSLLAKTCAGHWQKFLTERSLGLDWLTPYPTTPPPATEPLSAEGIDGPLEGGGEATGEVDEDEDEDEDELDPVDPEFEETFEDLPGN